MNSQLFKAFHTFEGKVLSNLAIFLFAVASLIVVIEVVGRYFFGHSFMWAQETVTYLTACSAFLYFGLTEGGSGLSSGHLRVNLVVQLIRSAKLKKIVTIISTLLGIGYCLMFIWLALPITRMFYNKKVSSLNAGLPIWIFYGMLCLGMILLIIHMIETVIISWKESEGGEK